MSEFSAYLGKFALTLLLAASLVGCAHDQARPPTPPELNKLAMDLLDSLERGEFVELARFVPDKRKFILPDETQDFHDFLYGTDGKSIGNILRMGSIRYRVLMSFDGHYATIFYYPARYATEAKQGLGFFEKTWMTKSFACEAAFYPYKGWRIDEGFCFYATEGPFPPADIG